MSQQNPLNSLMGGTTFGDLVPTTQTIPTIGGYTNWYPDSFGGQWAQPTIAQYTTVYVDKTEKALKVARLFYKGKDIDEFLALVDKVKEALA